MRQQTIRRKDRLIVCGECPRPSGAVKRAGPPGQTPCQNRPGSASLGRAWLIALAALLLASVLWGGSCDLPESPDFGKGTLTLFLPGTRAAASRAALPDSVISSLVYRVTAAGPGETQTLDAGGGGTTLTLDAGTWTIHAVARDPANPAVTVGSGSAVIAVAAGRNNSARIPMKVDPAYAAGLTEFSIYTEADLRRVGTDFAIDGSVKFYLEQDIVLTQPWKAIGSGTDPFMAEFDGQGHRITVRAFDGPVLLMDPIYNVMFQGFFASTSGALIKDTAVRYELSGPADIRTGDPAAYAYAFTGGIAGGATNTVFENIQVTGTFEIIADVGSGLHVGGIVGNCTGITITNCHVSGDIGGDSASHLYIGGIGGALTPSTTTTIITGSSFTGRIEGEGDNYVWAGGIVSYIGNTSGRVEKCYAAGIIQGTSVSSQAYSGGIAGQINSGTIENCYARTYVETQAASYISSAGGIAGNLEGSGTLSGSYALGTVKAVSTVAAVSRPAGGIFGMIPFGANTVTTKYCVALNQTIEAPAPNNNTGGIGGTDAGSGSSYTSNFAASDISFIPSQTATGDLTGNVTLSRSAFEGPANQGNYPPAGWTFGAGGNWKYIAGYAYPVLSWQDSPPADPATIP